jgi:hypothetical protein
VYRHCLFCHADLVANDEIEALPIGRRLAFDAAKGRLWVVCRTCERWNLTPFDARWEAIERCERLFRSTRTRMSTDQIGLARLPSGLELVRIGEPLRPEFAAWRYGDQFGRRRRRYLAYSAVGVAAGIGMIAGLYTLTASIGGFAGMGSRLIAAALDRVRAIRVPRAHGGVTRIGPARARLASISVVPPGTPPVLRVPESMGAPLQRGDFWVGDDALAVASVIAPLGNASGGSRDEIRRAVEIIEGSATPDDPVRTIADANPGYTVKGELSIAGGYPPHRLALEMMLHEAAERRALAGELAVLELRWRQAEELAAIADSLAVSEAVETRLRELRGRRPQA